MTTDCTPFTAIGPDELGSDLPQTISCDMCGEDHEIHGSTGTTTDEHGNKKSVTGTLQYFTCNGKTYIAGIKGKSIITQ